MTVRHGRSHSRSCSVKFGPPASCTPGRTPNARANRSGSSSKPGDRRPFASPAGSDETVEPAFEGDVTVLVDQGREHLRASAMTGSGIAPPDMPECCGPSSARSSMSAAARPRNE